MFLDSFYAKHIMFLDVFPKNKKWIKMVFFVFV